MMPDQLRHLRIFKALEDLKLALAADKQTKPPIKPMKNKTLKILIGVAAFGLATITTQAQNSTNSIFVSAEAYFTSFNPAFNWTTNSSWQIDTGYKQVINEPAADALDVQYNFAIRINASADLEFDGVGSSVNSITPEIGYAIFEDFDTVVDARLGAGYDFNLKAFKFEPNLTLKKKMTDNTFSFLRVALPYYAGSQFSRNPSIEAGFGITF